ncbi:AtzG-like protein [Variovorax sp. KK3]|uniref:AtzG-like protein n=1 Tax=Variovorax sp. KK3 TaxID=1855728 RepID=UPI0015C4013A|nr:AtzG-like protein [Variovorax sp. KK3]
MKPAPIESYVDAAAAALDLRLRSDHRPGVLRYFALAAEFAAVVDAVPLDMHDESAVHFVPVVPTEPQE